jgi:hypothetical protein
LPQPIETPLSAEEVESVEDANNDIVSQDIPQEETKIELEIQKINREYEDKIQEQKGKVRKKIKIIIAIINIIILLAVAILTHPIFLLVTAFALTAIDGLLQLISILTLDNPNFIENKLTKDEKIIKLLEHKKTKETKLSEINKILSELSKNIIKYRSKSKQLNEKKNYIEESLNDLLRNYAEPIFEEQLKTYQEALKEEGTEVKEEQQKRKTRS